MSKSQHWYDKDGKAVFEVPKAKGGGMRATTIADARKLGLYPSVTTILSVMAKPQLDDWKLQQVAERAFSNPPQDGEEASSYARRTIDGAFEQVTDAADLGTAIHAAIEAHFKADLVPEGMQVYVQPVVAALAVAGIRITQHELRLVNDIAGYAGTTDAVMVRDGKQGILDFKSRKTKPGVKCEPWDTEPMQIAAYGVANFGSVPTCGANVYISTTEPGRVDIVHYDHNELRSAWYAFQSIVVLWQYLKGYTPPSLSATSNTSVNISNQ
jgi:hypothetical protein